MSSKTIICFGEVLWDMLPSGAKPGGAPLNVAVHLLQQGQYPKLISRIGKDEEGQKLLDFLSTSGLKTTFIQRDESLPTSKVLIHLDENKNARYEICEPVAWDNITYYNKLEALTKKADAIVYGSLASRNPSSLQTLLKLCKNTKAQKLMDVNLRPPYNNRETVKQLLKLADFVKLNDEELIEICQWNAVSGNEKQLIEWFASFYSCNTLCITRGAYGAVLFINGNFHTHPGYKVKTVDTVGAGDAFFARLIAGLSQSQDAEKALDMACATGAYVATQHGAVPNYTEKDIESIKKSQN